MNDQLTEQEQIQAIKDWWRENGTQVLVVGCLVAAAYFGYNWWQNKKESDLNTVSLAYEQYIEAVSEAATLLEPSEEQVRTVAYLTDQLAEEHANSHYAFLAALNTAAFDLRRADYESALERLEWAKAQAEAEADQQLVDYRYALVQALLGDTEAAITTLENPNEHFESIYAEARGDILLSAGRSSEALTAYELALASAVPEDINRITLLEATIGSLQTGPLSIAQ